MLSLDWQAFDELWYAALHAVSEILKALIVALKDSLKKAPTESLLFDNYGRLCLILDEMIYEVILRAPGWHLSISDEPN